MSDFEIKSVLVKYKGKGGKVIIPDSVTAIGDEAFFGCKSLKSISIPSSVTSIGEWAFHGCESLESVEIPSSVTDIGDEAFRDCESLTSVEIPSSVTSIGDSAFSWCTSLKSIKIPFSITNIGERAFSWCNSLNHIEVAKDNPKYYSENNCIIEKRNKALIAGCNASTIPEGVKIIGNSAFYGCTLMQSIKIPSSVKSIKKAAFSSCSLKNISIPSRFKGQEERLGIRKECEITYLDDDEEIIYSKN